jgi:pyruvate dehydrogenase E2 component (dihydrolipoamide acetyltransferase)
MEIIVPKLYEDLETAILVEWFKKEKDHIKVGDAIFSLETDKAVFDIESENEGYLDKILVGGNSKVRVMDVVGLISTQH